MSEIKITFDVAKPTEGCYADDFEDRLKENVASLFNSNLRCRLLQRISKAIVAHEDIKEREQDAELSQLLMKSIIIEIKDDIQITFCAECDRSIDDVYELFFDNMVTRFEYDDWESYKAPGESEEFVEAMKAAIKKSDEEDFAFINAMFDNVVVEVV